MVFGSRVCGDLNYFFPYFFFCCGGGVGASLGFGVWRLCSGG